MLSSFIFCSPRGVRSHRSRAAQRGSALHLCTSQLETKTPFRATRCLVKLLGVTLAEHHQLSPWLGGEQESPWTRGSCDTELSRSLPSPRWGVVAAATVLTHVTGIDFSKSLYFSPPERSCAGHIHNPFPAGKNVAVNN